MARSKVFPGIVFVLLLMVVGFVAGLFIGAPFVPPGSGLAAGAMVLGYGVLGMVIALVVGIVLAVKLSRGALVRAMWIALAGVALAALALFVRYQFAQQARQVEHDSVEMVVKK